MVVITRSVCLHLEMWKRDVERVSQGRLDDPGTVPVVGVGVWEVRALYDATVVRQDRVTNWMKNKTADHQALPSLNSVFLNSYIL